MNFLELLEKVQEEDMTVMYHQLMTLIEDYNSSSTGNLGAYPGNISELSQKTNLVGIFEQCLELTAEPEIKEASCFQVKRPHPFINEGCSGTGLYLSPKDVNSEGPDICYGWKQIKKKGCLYLISVIVTCGLIELIIKIGMNG